MALLATATSLLPPPVPGPPLGMGHNDTRELIFTVLCALPLAVGLVWALIYARFVESNRSLRWWIGDGPGWSRGMRFALLPWIFSLLLLLPAAAINMLDWALSAGPLVPVGIALHVGRRGTFLRVSQTDRDASS